MIQSRATHQRTQTFLPSGLCILFGVLLISFPRNFCTGEYAYANFHSKTQFDLFYNYTLIHRLVWRNRPTSLNIEPRLTAPPAPAPAFSPQSSVQLKSAVDVCIKLSPRGKFFDSPRGPIREWDVSRVTDMSKYTCICSCKIF